MPRADQRPQLEIGQISLFPLEYLKPSEKTLAMDVLLSGPAKAAEKLAKNLVALSRSSDPETSKLAGENSKEFRARHISRIWGSLKDFGPMNKNEIALRTGLDATQVARRGKEMELNHLVSIGPDSKDGCRLWRAIC